RPFSRFRSTGFSRPARSARRSASVSARLSAFGSSSTAVIGSGARRPRCSKPSRTSSAMTPTDRKPDDLGGIRRLLEIMATLRDRERGCPWDLEQTFETIAPYTIEEAYEVADAIERGDVRGLEDELGDLLFQ